MTSNLKKASEKLHTNLHSQKGLTQTYVCVKLSSGVSDCFKEKLRIIMIVRTGTMRVCQTLSSS